MTTLTTTNNKIKNPSHKHEILIQWLLENPHRSLGEAAAELGYTQAWLSIMIHSDLFQAKFAEVREHYFGSHFAEIGEKLEGLAHAALDKLVQQVELNDSPEFLLKTADKALERLGYGSKPASPTIINNGVMQVAPASYNALKHAEEMRAKLRNTNPQLIEGEAINEKTEAVARSDRHTECDSEPQSAELREGVQLYRS